MMSMDRDMDRCIEGGRMMEWQPIETASSGPAIVYDTEKGVIPNAYLFSNDGRANYGYYRNTAYNVTHWMPLPDPPTEGVSE